MISEKLLAILKREISRTGNQTCCYCEIESHVTADYLVAETETHFVGVCIVHFEKHYTMIVEEIRFWKTLDILKQAGHGNYTIELTPPKKSRGRRKLVTVDALSYGGAYEMMLRYNSNYIGKSKRLSRWTNWNGRIISFRMAVDHD